MPMKSSIFTLTAFVLTSFFSCCCLGDEWAASFDPACSCRCGRPFTTCLICEGFSLSPPCDCSPLRVCLAGEQVTVATFWCSCCLIMALLIADEGIAGEASRRRRLCCEFKSLSKTELFVSRLDRQNCNSTWLPSSLLVGLKIPPPPPRL